MVALCSGGSEESVPEMEIGDTRVWRHAGGIVGCSGGTRDVGCLGLRWGTEQTKVYAVNLSLNWARGWEEGTL